MKAKTVLLRVLLVAMSLGCGRRSADEVAPAGAADEARRPAEVNRDDTGSVVVTLTPEAHARAGLRTAVLVAASSPRVLSAYGRVLDPTPLLSLEAEAEAASAAMLASRPEAERLRRLGKEGDTIARKRASRRRTLSSRWTRTRSKASSARSCSSGARWSRRFSRPRDATW